MENGAVCLQLWYETNLSTSKMFNFKINLPTHADDAVHKVALFYVASIQDDDKWPISGMTQVSRTEHKFATCNEGGIISFWQMHPEKGYALR